MNLKTLRSLTDRQKVRLRLGKAGSNSVIWNDWVIDEIYVSKRNTPLKRKLPGRINEKDALLTVTPYNYVTAEFSENDYCSDSDVFSCEEYYMQIDWSSIT